MLHLEYEEAFKEIYNKAEAVNPELKELNIIYNTNSDMGVKVAKGTDEHEGVYKISCPGFKEVINTETSSIQINKDDILYTMYCFALGIALIVYGIKYKEEFKENKDNAEKLNDILYEFFDNDMVLEKI